MEKNVFQKFKAIVTDEDWAFYRRIEGHLMPCIAASFQRTYLRLLEFSTSSGRTCDSFEDFFQRALLNGIAEESIRLKSLETRQRIEQFKALTPKPRSGGRKKKENT